ncbi:MBL fold metallo-hydrolase [Alteromonas oceanisediminis]|uniref:MBL fold metallo-hydrolase n=1 Tax=Alteromonas oceanisediminis TaxID=2836180 RepID=UPI001BD93C8D|nr:MBL fold metallo-hydrolase [Alteromonas oceanisediminis]MBT0585275.1 MBL fold metallo-hydrolase [Alteromonas oceanisediminis]
MRSVLSVSVVFGAILSFSAVAQLATTKITENVILVKSSGSNTNIGLIQTSQGNVVVDPVPGAAHLDALNVLAKEHFGGSVDLILNTHQHRDHSGGNDYFIERGGKLISQDNTLDSVQILTVKAHSAEDNIICHSDSNVIFVGDIYDTSWHPTFWAGGRAGFSAAVSKILEIGNDQTLIVPGHGEPSSKKQLTEFLGATLDWVAHVEQLHREGKTVKEIQTAAKTREILERFNVENKSPFLPQGSITTFINRTLQVIENEIRPTP